jgi:hypothetical protein
VDIRVGFGEGRDMSLAEALRLSRRHDSKSSPLDEFVYMSEQLAVVSGGSERGELASLWT